MNKKKIFLISFVCLIALTPIILFAQEKLLPDCTIDGNCGFCDFIQLGLNIFRWILGALAGAALLMFVWHGFGWLSSMGDAEKVKKSKDGLIHTVVGILIVLASWLIVNLIITLLVNPVPQAGGVPPTGAAKIFSATTDWTHAWNSWASYCEKIK
ncbi:MAG: pilin [Patescibacteria group bacterium]|jgi:hypothetical protein